MAPSRPGVPVAGLGSPTSSAVTRDPSWRSGVGDHRLEQAAVGLLDLGPPPQLGLSVRSARRERVAHPLQLADAEHPRPADGAHAPTRCPAGGRPRRRARRAAAPGGRSGGEGRRGLARSGATSRLVAKQRRPGRTGVARAPSLDLQQFVRHRGLPSDRRGRAIVAAAKRKASRGYLGGQPERLLDRDVGHALDLHRDERHPRGRGLDAAAGADRAEQQRERPRLVGDHQRARGQGRPAGPRAPRPRPLGRMPSGPSTPIGVEGPQRDARLDDRDRQRVVEQALADEPAALHPLQRHRLDRGRLLVRVEADVAKEDAVRPRDRLVAELDRLGAREAVRQPREAVLDALAGFARSRARSTR